VVARIPGAMPAWAFVPQAGSTTLDRSRVRGEIKPDTLVL